jgi:hypothetical protein
MRSLEGKRICNKKIKRPDKKFHKSKDKKKKTRRTDKN